MINQTIVQAASELIQRSASMAVVCHISPDGDALGAALSLYQAILVLDKPCFVICDDPVPQKYKYLPYSERIHAISSEQAPVELIITVDCGDVQRVGMAAQWIGQGKACINIDHHVSNTHYGTVNLVTEKAGSTSEIIYHVIKAMQVPLTVDMGTCIYNGMITDTDRFTYDSTTPDSLRIAAHLMELGIDFSGIAERAFRTTRLSYTKLLASALQTLMLSEDGQIGLITITQEMLTLCSAMPEDVEGIINHVASIQSVFVAALMQEKSWNDWKVSLRASGSARVDGIAAMLQGGGHARAAGCKIHGEYGKAKQELMTIIREKAFA